MLKPPHQSVASAAARALCGIFAALGSRGLIAPSGRSVEARVASDCARKQTHEELMEALPLKPRDNLCFSGGLTYAQAIDIFEVRSAHTNSRPPTHCAP